MGILGNQRLQVLPIWELLFTKMPEEPRKIATERLKWSLHVPEEARHRERRGQGPARRRSRRASRRSASASTATSCCSGYARIDLRLSRDGRVYVIEANPNPQLAHDEDFAQSAKAAGIDYGGLIQRIVNLGLDWEPTRLG